MHELVRPGSGLEGNKGLLESILCWQDDGGAGFETVNSVPQVAETNTPRSMDVTGDDLSYDEIKDKLLKRR
jgi:hypothetical protein